MKIATSIDKHESTRHQRPSSLLFLWFTSNMQLTTIITGALAVTLHVPLPSALVGIILGNVIGGLLMALHSTQGPQLSAPQLIMTRKLFGNLGSLLPFTVFTLMYVGFYATTSTIGGQLLSQYTHVPFWLSVVTINIFTIVPIYTDGQFIRFVQNYLAYIFFITFLYLTFSLHLHNRPLLLQPISSHLSLVSVLIMMSIVVTWQISYTPYVSDYSRLLTANSSRWRVLWFTAIGTIFSSVWMMSLGAVAAWSGVSNNEITNGKFLFTMIPSFIKVPIIIVLISGMIIVNSFNLYGAYISITAIFFLGHKSENHQRLMKLAILTMLCTGIALWGENNFMLKYSAFLNILVYFLIPWSVLTLLHNYFRSQTKRRHEPFMHFLVYLSSVLIEFCAMIISQWFHGAQLFSIIIWVIGMVSSIALYFLGNIILSKAKL